MAATDENPKSSCVRAASQQPMLQDKLEVGQCVFLEINPDLEGSARCKTTVLGWDQGHFLMLDKTEHRAISLLRKGQKCAVRFMKDGEIWGFYTYVDNPQPISLERFLQVAWPKSIARVRVRRHERVNLTTPCTFLFRERGSAQGVLTDLSAGGCRIRTNHEISEGEECRLSCLLPEGPLVESIQIIVRNRQMAAPGVADLGCEFLRQDESEGYGIGLYVGRLLAQRREQRQSPSRIILMSHAPSELAVIQAALGTNDYELLSVSGVLELGYVLRTAPPRILLISSDQRELSAVDICRIVKGTPNFAAVPVIIYGGQDGTLDEKAQAAGAALCLHDLSMADRLLPMLQEIFT